MMLKNVAVTLVFLCIIAALEALLIAVFDITGPGLSLRLFIKTFARFLLINIALAASIYLIWKLAGKKGRSFLPWLSRLKFKTKLAFAFSFMIFLPTMLLLFVSYYLVSRSIDKWADEKVERALVESDKLTFALERFHALPLSEVANQIASNSEIRANLTNKKALESAMTSLLHEEDQVIAALYDSQGNKIFSTEEEMAPANLSEIIPLEELSNQPTTSAISMGEGELFICAVPIYKDKVKIGEAIAGKLLPFARASIEEGHKLYRLTALTRAEARKATIAIFALTGMLILVVAFWSIASITKAISVPIQSLLRGTEEVAKGNLDYKVGVSTEDEFGQVAKSFNKMTYDLCQITDELKRAEKMAVWQEVAQKLAHEIKNPLTPIQLCAQRLERNYGADPQKYAEILHQCTQMIVEEVENLRNLLDNFSRLAKMPSSKFTETNVNDLMLKALKLYGEPPAHIKFELELEPNLPTLMIDEEQIKSAFFNLIKNAVEAMESGGTLTIKSEKSEKSELPQRNFVSIRFEDMGSGLTPEALEKLFMPQFSTKKDGMGLGLAIVRKIVDDHGGEIKVENNPTRGASVTILLPIRSA